MTHTEKTRFIILFILLVFLVGIGFAIQRARQSGKVGADVLGQISNQAVATFKDKDGNAMDPTLSDQSDLLVASGKNQVTITYKLESSPNQSVDVDIQFFRTGEDVPILTLPNKKGQSGTIFINVKNLANGSYKVSIKPKHYLARMVSDISYENGKPVIIDVKDPFLWGDIDITHDGRGDNGDNQLNSLDWAVLASAFDSADQKADLNADGIVNTLDAAVLLTNWGEHKPVDFFDIDQIKPSPVAIPDSAE